MAGKIKKTEEPHTFENQFSKSILTGSGEARQGGGSLAEEALPGLLRELVPDGGTIKPFLCPHLHNAVMTFHQGILRSVSKEEKCDFYV